MPNCQWTRVCYQVSITFFNKIQVNWKSLNLLLSNLTFDFSSCFSMSDEWSLATFNLAAIFSFPATQWVVLSRFMVNFSLAAKQSSNQAFLSSAFLVTCLWPSWTVCTISSILPRSGFERSCVKLSSFEEMFSKTTWRVCKSSSNLYGRKGESLKFVFLEILKKVKSVLS